MDVIEIDILEDGTISVTTDSFKTVNHVSAEEFLDGISEQAGGIRTTTQRPSEFWKNKAVLKGGRIVKINQ